MVKTSTLAILALGYLFLRGRATAAPPSGQMLQPQQPPTGGQWGQFFYEPVPSPQDTGAAARADEEEEMRIVEENIFKHQQEQGPPPPGYRYVQADTGIGIMPTAGISEQEAVARLPPEVRRRIAPGRIKYQASIGIPILTSEQYEREVRKAPYIPASLSPQQKKEAIAYQTQIVEQRGAGRIGYFTPGGFKKYV